ncbi:MAG TPA: DUF5946 family protein [Herpetosiphonaceae bacterium]
MTHQCPECGAPWPAGQDCDSYFGLCLAEEQAQPAFYAVHQLIVPAFMLQHNRYSREGWLATRKLLGRFLDGLTPAEGRREINEAQRGGKGPSLIRGPKLAAVAEIRWGETIAGVRLDTAENYCADVRRWAAAVCADSAHLLE